MMVLVWVSALYKVASNISFVHIMHAIIMHSDLFSTTSLAFKDWGSLVLFSPVVLLCEFYRFSCSFVIFYIPQHCWFYTKHCVVVLQYSLLHQCFPATLYHFYGISTLHMNNLFSEMWKLIPFPHHILEFLHSFVSGTIFKWINTTAASVSNIIICIENWQY